MATTLYLIRHGETIGSDAKRYKGSIDVPLSERGIEQIKKVSVFIAEKLKLSAVYCSGLSRAARTAEIIAGPHGLKPMVMHDLRERNFGLWEGMTFSEIKELYPSEFEAWASDPLRHSPIDGESTIEVYERAIRTLDSIVSKHMVESVNQDVGADNIAIVAHGGVNRIILCHVMGVPLENLFRIEQDFAAVNIIEFWERGPRKVENISGCGRGPKKVEDFSGSRYYPLIKLLNGGPIG